MHNQLCLDQPERILMPILRDVLGFPLTIHTKCSVWCLQTVPITAANNKRTQNILGARRVDADVSMASRTWMSFKGSHVLLTGFWDTPWRKES